MSDLCRAVRDRLADGELDAAATEHLRTCADCEALSRALSDLDLAAAALPAPAPADALVARTLAHIEADMAAQHASSAAPASRELGLGGVLHATLAAVLSGLHWLLGGVAAGARGLLSTLRGSTGGPRWSVIAPLAAVSLLALMVGTSSLFVLRSAGPAHDQSVAVEGARVTTDGVPATGADQPDIDGLRHQGGDYWDGDDDGRDRDRNALLVPEDTEREVVIDGTGFSAGQHTIALATSGNSETPDQRRQRAFETTLDWEQTGEQGQGGGSRDETTRRLVNEPIEGEQGIVVDDRAGNDRHAAGRFLADRSRLTGLAFQEPKGYWANTYLPGDPAVRLLHRRLLASSSTVIGATGLSGLALAELASRSRQPLDAPSDGALALYVHADRAAVEGPSRAVLQVGIKGAVHHGGRRPAMRVAMVLDLSQGPDEPTRQRARALIEALGRARDTGDRFSLFVAGPRGGGVLEDAELRHGAIAVTLERLFSGTAEQPGEPMAVPEAVRAALGALGSGDGERIGLSTPLVLLVTPGIATADGAELEHLAHLGALAGITTSVVGLGPGAQTEALEPIALAGQGRRTVLSTPDEATALVRDEVQAVSRAVARSLRLHIRLAPGVRLVDVLGSHRLDAEQAARVRRAEQATDLELANRLGITLDRGDDEDGIQIVIPVFYAEDDHVILLDLVVPGPGPVADVRVRYKDLLRLRNGSADGSLALRRGRESAGPLELNVLENVVAHEVARGLSDTSRRLERGDLAAAAARIEEVRALLGGVRQEIPELARNAEIGADLELASRYAAALSRAAGADTTTLVDSLRYAARRRR